jgi:hypothetical protein
MHVDYLENVSLRVFVEIKAFLAQRARLVFTLNMMLISALVTFSKKES